MNYPNIAQGHLGSGGGGGGGGFNRLPQWSVEETREFLAIRAELDEAFMETRRNKLLWNVVSSKMREKGFHRTPEQCKSKWKNLVTRYKGSEAMMESNTRSFTFHEEVKSIYTKRMRRLLLRRTSSSIGGGGDVGDDEKKRWSGGDKDGLLGDVLREFMERQLEREGKWREAAEEREEERRVREVEWREEMEALMRERAEMDRTWWEREEERRAKVEARAERRHALIMALLTRIIDKYDTS
ncbi:Trihelix transcription factor GT-3b [Acorus gramineus]|uniref:Trihelix transcription factor GT-3b n=1 Tax=Acorus gramineus TaxID=55184 RepID=A0AAV9AKT9_ACOGR|nr:Trihelix transcription factor GT-3b [Acorus gramineus]